MKIININFKNVNGLPDQDFNVQGQVVLVVAKNGKGKSLIQSVVSILESGTATVSDAKRIVPSDPSTPGSISGEIIDENNNPYRYEIKVSEKDGNISRTLVVQDTHGGKYGKKETILSLFGNPRVFNAEEYVANQSHSAGVAKNEKMISDLLGIDIGPITEKIYNLAEERKKHAIAVKETEQLLKSLNMTEEQVLNVGDEVDIAALKNELDKARSHNDAITQAQSNLKTITASIDAVSEQITELQRQLKIAIDKSDKLHHDAEKAAMEMVDLGSSIDTEEISKRYEEAVSFNSGRQTAMKIRPQVKALPEIKNKWDRLSKEIEQKRAERVQIISDAANKALPGFVSVGLDEKDKLVITTEMNGNYVPLSTAPSSRVPVVEALMNAHFTKEHRMKIVPVRNANLLDKESRMMLIEKAKEVGASVWMEIVDMFGDKDGVEIRVSETYTEPKI
ncbi:AAA family ATPase [uncultured Sphaerochaeta sp.]|uniref:AAA family ATPase n=1 Tax=uncultured Sphaerochaeta sp. TaxID=886478 RepID=UPI00261A1720|nr:AAA family ATPase [uncultured Sphaerochaeta sp.]